MLEVVFGIAEKNAIKYAQLHFSDTGSTFQSLENGQPLQKKSGSIPTLEKPNQKKEGAGSEICGKNLHNIICLPFALDIGDIACSLEDTPRRDVLSQILGLQFADAEWKQMIDDYNKLLKRAKNGERVRIWYTQAPYSMCGLYFVVYQLKNYECSVSAIQLPQYAQQENQGVSPVVSWGEIRPIDFINYLVLESKISGPVRRAMVSEWENLRHENAPLRINLNGKLQSAAIDFYDSMIRNAIPDTDFEVSRLICLMLDKKLGIGDRLIAQRIHKMVDLGELILIRDHAEFYHAILKKNSQL